MSNELTIHDRMILLLQRDYPHSRTKGFRKAVQQLQWDWESWDDARSDEEKPAWRDFTDWGEAWDGGIIPDLWFIDEDCMSVVCIEVEDTNRIGTGKLNQYVRLWWHLDEMYWELHLICSDRWGHLTPVPVADFTSMGMVEIEGHRLASVIQAERDAKKTVFDLTKIYSIRDSKQRDLARREWMEQNRGFCLRTNPDFNKKSFLLRRGLEKS
jgi:hypothetical protein